MERYFPGGSFVSPLETSGLSRRTDFCGLGFLSGVKFSGTLPGHKQEGRPLTKRSRLPLPAVWAT